MGKEEKRRFKRAKKSLYVQFRPFEATDSWIGATIQDISEGGMCIIARREFAIGDILEIKINTFLRPQPIGVLGEVVGCAGKGSESTAWITHISFTNVNEEDRPLLRELMRIFLEAAKKEQ